MDFQLDLLETKIEFYEATDLRTLEKQIQTAVDNNKALLLDVYAVQHHSAYHPRMEKLVYSAVVHFKLKR